MTGSSNQEANKDYSEASFSYVSDPTVVIDSVSKTYKISQGNSFDGRIGNKLGKSFNKVEALKNISFATDKGESIGLIGLNGSGKSTLCRIIAGTEPPTAGRVFVKSRPILLGVGAALQLSLTGRENILLGLLAMGIRRKEANELVGSISEWIDIGDAIDRPMVTYSAGMGARLRFAVSTAIKPDILLVDEALSTGDAAFNKKAEERMLDVINNAGNLFFVSHGIEQIKENTSRCIWLGHGEIIADGPTTEVAELYTNWANRLATQDGSAPSMLAEIKEEYKKPTILFDRLKGGKS